MQRAASECTLLSFLCRLRWSKLLAAPGTLLSFHRRLGRDQGGTEELFYMFIIYILYLNKLQASKLWIACSRQSLNLML